MLKYLSMALVLACSTVVLAQVSPGGRPQSLPKSPLVVESGDIRHAFTIELADNATERAIGMMFRTEMADDQGMLFRYFHPQRLAFWMKNTYVPLDIIFIDKNARIRNIAAMAEPLSLRSLPSDGPVIAVLEIRGGLAQELGIGPGDLVRHKMFGNLAAGE